MRSVVLKGLLLGAFVASASLSPSAGAVAVTGQGPSLTSLGPLAFGPDGTLFAADNQAASLFALELGATPAGVAPGAKGLDALDQKIAALAGTASARIWAAAFNPRAKVSIPAMCA